MKQRASGCGIGQIGALPQHTFEQGEGGNVEHRKHKLIGVDELGVLRSHVWLFGCCGNLSRMPMALHAQTYQNLIA
jgi:hypothetical protein